MARTIVPAHDERVQVEIHVPVKGRKTPLRFIAPRFEFIDRALAEKFDEWLTEFFKTDGDEEAPILTEELMLNYWIERLGMKDADALLGLTRGEKKQIWEAWRDESNAPLGESAPSSDS